jgi:hypothetical protein
MKRSKLHTRALPRDGFDTGPCRGSRSRRGGVHEVWERTKRSRWMRSRHRSESAVTIEKRIPDTVPSGDDPPDKDRMRAEIGLRAHDAIEHRFAVLDHRRRRRTRSHRHAGEWGLGTAGKMPRQPFLALRKNMDGEDATITNKGVGSVASVDNNKKRRRVRRNAAHGCRGHAVGQRFMARGDHANRRRKPPHRGLEIGGRNGRKLRDSALHSRRIKRLSAGRHAQIITVDAPSWCGKPLPCLQARRCRGASEICKNLYLP